MKNFVAITKALADKNRVRALMALGRKEACVCRVIELLRLAPSTVSKHMAILKQAGLVESRKQGRWIYFRLAQNNTDPAATRFIALAQELLQSDEAIAADRKRMAEICKQDPGSLCRKQRT
jgi:DNA-binding transcriptional ArsR family regulator